MSVLPAALSLLIAVMTQKGGKMGFTFNMSLLKDSWLT
jgi:hypothetical protein